MLSKDLRINLHTNLRVLMADELLASRLCGLYSDARLRLERETVKVAPVAFLVHLATQRTPGPGDVRSPTRTPPLT
jgi:hypothetical protein